jgi:hypothetical protein
MTDAEKEKNEHLYHINNKTYTAGIQSDVERSYTISGLEKEIEKIQNIKQEIISNIILLNNQREYYLLSIDNIMFDNCVMADILLKNFKELQEI